MKTNDEGWLKLHRKLQEWEWYTDSYMVHLLLHLIMTMNTKSIKFRGIVIERGQRACTVDELCGETGIGKTKLKECLKLLQDCDAISVKVIKTSSRFSIIGLKNYEKYQCSKGRVATLDATPNATLTATSDTTPVTTFPIIEQEVKKEEDKNKTLSHTPGARESMLQELEDAYTANALKNQSWKESVMMKHKLTAETFDIQWQEFILDCRASNKTHDSENDVQDHFNKWLTNKTYLDGRYKQKTAQREGRGSMDRRRPNEVSHKGTEDYTEAL